MKKKSIDHCLRTLAVFFIVRALDNVGFELVASGALGVDELDVVTVAEATAGAGSAIVDSVLSRASNISLT